MTAFLALLATILALSHLILLNDLVRLYNNLVPRPTSPPHLLTHTFQAIIGLDSRTSHRTLCRTPRYHHPYLPLLPLLSRFRRPCRFVNYRPLSRSLHAPIIRLCIDGLPEPFWRCHLRNQIDRHRIQTFSQSLSTYLYLC